MGVGGAEAVVFFGEFPADEAGAVEEVGGGVGDVPAAGDGAGVAEAVAVGDAVVGVGEKSDDEIPLRGGLDLGDHHANAARRIRADGDDHGGVPQVRREQGVQLDQLRDAVASPVAAVEDEDDVLAAEIGEGERAAVAGGEAEIGRGEAGADAVEVAGREAGAVARPELLGETESGEKGQNQAHRIILHSLVVELR